MLARLVALAAVLVLSAIPFAAADHPQPGDSGETVTFDHRGGNEWWVEVRVTVQTSEPQNVHVDRVEARDDGGEWKVLTLRSWGNWAASFHIEPGHKVEFRAFQHGGMSDARTWTSCRFSHPAGVESCLSTDPDPEPGTFDAAFSGVKGNSWWQEVKVSATGGTLAGVDVRMDGGAWKPLEKKSWGAWADSYHAPEGTLVQFRARSTGGAEDLSGCYRWTAATPVACSGGGGGEPTPGTFDAKFTGVKGNSWWEEVKVTATGGTLAGVDVRIGSGDWRPLSLKSWGAWAASYNAPSGSLVQFRARSTGGLDDVSACYRWTGATLDLCADMWRRDGTFLTYRTHSRHSFGDEGEQFVTERWANMTYRFFGGKWDSMCTWHKASSDPGEPTVHSFGSVSDDTDLPLMFPSPVGVGTRVENDVLHGCDRLGIDVVITASGERMTVRDGRPIEVTAYDGEEHPDTGDTQDIALTYEKDTGFPLAWDVSRFASTRLHAEGELVATNGPFH